MAPKGKFRRRSVEEYDQMIEANEVLAGMGYSDEALEVHRGIVARLLRGRARAVRIRRAERQAQKATRKHGC